MYNKKAVLIALITILLAQKLNAEVVNGETSLKDREPVPENKVLAASKKIPSIEDILKVSVAPQDTPAAVAEDIPEKVEPIIAETPAPKPEIIVQKPAPQKPKLKKHLRSKKSKPEHELTLAAPVRKKPKVQLLKKLAPKPVTAPAVIAPIVLHEIPEEEEIAAAPPEEEGSLIASVMTFFSPEENMDNLEEEEEPQLIPISLESKKKL